MAADLRARVELAPLDMEKHKAAAGVGGLAKKGFRFVQLTPVTKEGNQAVVAGRFLMFAASGPGGVYFHVYCLYGWTGGQTSTIAAARTAALFKAV